MPAFVPRPRVGHLWLDTQDGWVRADRIDIVTCDMQPHVLPPRPLTIDLPVLGHQRIRIPKFLKRARRKRSRIHESWHVIVETANGEFIVAVRQCEHDGNDTTNALLTALYEHRNKAGVLACEEGGWRLTAFDATGQPEAHEQNGEAR